MATFDRYILSQIFPSLGMTLLVALMILLVERLLRVLDLVLGNSGPLHYVARMLAYLAPEAPRVVDATVFSRPGCPHCSRAKRALEAARIEYEELVLNRDFSDRTIRAVTDQTSYPQVFINGVHVGGADELEAWLADPRAA